MKQFVTNLRTPLSVFTNQTATGAWVSLASTPCTAVVFTILPSPTSGVNNGIMVRRGATGGQVYIEEGMAYEVAVLANANELQIQTSQGTSPVAGMECKTYNGDLVYPAIG